MEEEVTDRTVRLAITSSKLTARTLVDVFRWLYSHGQQKGSGQFNDTQSSGTQAAQKTSGRSNSGVSADDLSGDGDPWEVEGGYDQDLDNADYRAAPNVHQGKQSVRELVGQNQKLTNIPIEKTDIRDFDRIARKYGIDYAITKDRSSTPPKYKVFFKARDESVMEAAFSEYAAKAIKRTKSPGLLHRLSKAKEHLKGSPERLRSKGHGEQSR